MAYQFHESEHEARVRAKFAYYRKAEAAIDAGPETYQPPIHAQAETAACGTYSGWARHMREGTKPDRDCSDAQALYMRYYRARKVAA